MSAEANFRAKAPWIMALFQRALAIGVDDAAAILGNIGHESLGFTAMQETKPTVPGSRGGAGWPMWTGARRRSFESYCARQGYNPSADVANYKYMIVELSGAYKYAVSRLRHTIGLEAKVTAFELQYEGAGIKHYESRNRWAQIALDAWHKVGGKPTLPEWA
jgi:hypothetical protein